MRRRVLGRIEKKLRHARNRNPEFAAVFQARRKRNVPLLRTLREILLDPTLEHYRRDSAAEFLAIGDPGQASSILLRLFFEQSDPKELFETALVLETLNDRTTVEPLIDALSDNNAGRRRAAARALAWMFDRRAVVGLAQILTNPNEAVDARAQAAEGLANLRSKRAIPAILAALNDANPEVRFWCAFALGQIRDERCIPALDSMLNDDAVVTGWWSVGQEALGMLGSIAWHVADYRPRLLLEVMRVLQSSNSSQEDREWAEWATGHRTQPN